MRSKFTKPYRDRILRNLERGKPLYAAVAGAKVGTTTFKDWRAKANAAADKLENGGNLTAVERAYIDFFDQVDDAVFAGESELHDRWTEEAAKARRGNWMAYERMLRARFPADYAAQVQKVAVVGKGGGPVKIELAFVPDEKLAEELREK